jgi:transcription elongation factor Elf1
MLRDRLVCGIADDRIQRQLLAESTLTFLKFFESALALEAADKNLKELKGDNKSKLLKFDTEFPRQKQQRSPAKISAPPNRTSGCYRCGKKKHSANEWQFKTANCQKCGKTGHIAKVCKSKPRNHYKKQIDTHLITETESDFRGR